MQNAHSISMHSQTLNRIVRLSYVCLAAATLIPVTSNAAQWTGAGASDNWIDKTNWSPASVPTSSTVVYFEDAFYPEGSTNAAGVVNNIVTTNFTISQLFYSAAATAVLSGVQPSHYHTTQIDGGSTLAVTGSGLSGGYAAGFG